MLKFDLDTSPTFGTIPMMKSATLLPLKDKVKVIVGSNELIFGEEYVSGLNSMNRFGKFKSSALAYSEDSND